LAEQNIIVDKKEGIGVITLNRPKVLNALSRDLTRELDDAVSDMEADAEVKVIIFTGSGERAFSAGADIHEMARIAEDPNPQLPDTGRGRYAWHIAACEKPTIGALNGLAYGGGAVMASTFDIRVGCERTSFKFLAASYGRVNSTWSLPMQVGWPVAKELLLTARTVEAEEAHRIGLLNHLVPSDQLMTKAMELATQIAANDPRMVQGIKRLMIQDVGAGWEQMLTNEQDAQKGELQPTSVQEGFQQFLERKGRR
jgi:enoyl-CoA hydratase